MSTQRLPKGVYRKAGGYGWLRYVEGKQFKMRNECYPTPEEASFAREAWLRQHPIEPAPLPKPQPAPGSRGNPSLYNVSYTPRRQRPEHGIARNQLLTLRGSGGLQVIDYGNIYTAGSQV